MTVCYIRLSRAYNRQNIFALSLCEVVSALNKKIRYTLKDTGSNERVHLFDAEIEDANWNTVKKQKETIAKLQASNEMYLDDKSFLNKEIEVLRRQSEDKDLEIIKLKWRLEELTNPEAFTQR